MYDLLINPFNRVQPLSVPAIKVSSVRLSTLFLLLFLIPKCRYRNIDRSPFINMQSWSPFVSCLRKCKEGAGNECPAWSPSSSQPRQCEQEASCKCLAWSPSISCLKVVFNMSGDGMRCFLILRAYMFIQSFLRVSLELEGLWGVTWSHPQYLTLQMGNLSSPLFLLSGHAT